MNIKDFTASVNSVFYAIKNIQLVHWCIEVAKSLSDYANNATPTNFNTPEVSSTPLNNRVIEEQKDIQASLARSLSMLNWAGLLVGVVVIGIAIGCLCKRRKASSKSTHDKSEPKPPVRHEVKVGGDGIAAYGDVFFMPEGDHHYEEHKYFIQKRSPPQSSNSTIRETTSIHFSTAQTLSAPPPDSPRPSEMPVTPDNSEDLPVEDNPPSPPYFSAQEERSLVFSQSFQGPASNSNENSITPFPPNTVGGGRKRGAEEALGTQEEQGRNKRPKTSQIFFNFGDIPAEGLLDNSFQTHFKFKNIYGDLSSLPLPANAYSFHCGDIGPEVSSDLFNKWQQLEVLEIEGTLHKTLKYPSSIKYFECSRISEGVIVDLSNCANLSRIIVPKAFRSQIKLPSNFGNKMPKASTETINLAQE